MKKKLCPECKTPMEGFGHGELIHMLECPKCDYIEFTKLGQRHLAKALQNGKEGRTYTVSCSHYKGKGLFICWECLVKDCKRWHKLGKKDEAKRILRWLLKKGIWTQYDFEREFKVKP